MENFWVAGDQQPSIAAKVAPAATISSAMLNLATMRVLTEIQQTVPNPPNYWWKETFLLFFFYLVFVVLE
jgi:hypothetical protein